MAAPPAAVERRSPQLAGDDAGEPPPPPRARHAVLFETGGIALATALTFALCLYDLGTRSLWLDEANRVVVAQQRGAAFWSGIGGDGGNQAVYYCLLRVVTTLFGSSPVVVRLPSAIAAAATVPFAALVARRLFDSRAAVAAAFMTGVSLPLVYWGQAADGYALGALMATISCWAFLRLLDGPPGRSGRGGAGALVLYVAVSVLMIYTLMLTAFVLVGQACSLAFRRRGETPWRRLAPGAAAVVVLAVPLAIVAHAHGTTDISWLIKPSRGLVRFALRALASAGAQPEFPSITNTTRALLYATLFTWVVAGVLVVARLVRRREDLPAFAPAFLLCWLVVPVGVDWVVSVSVQPVFITRYLLYSLPAGSILTAAVVTRLRPVVLGAAVTVAFLVLRFLQIPEAYGRPFENWQAPTAYVLAHDRPGDCIAFYVDDGRMPFEYYLRRTPGHVTPPRPVLPAVPWSGNPVEVEVNTPIPSAAMPGVIGGCPRLFLVASHDGSPLGSPHQRAAYGDYHRMLDQLDAGYPTVGSRRFGSVTIWLFSR